jgi:tetratricopeptide (TPR) repeat protein
MNCTAQRISHFVKVFLTTAILLSCSGSKDQLNSDLKSLALFRGDVALCGSEEGKFGKVSFGLSCAEKVSENFNLATALLHSFEYSEAEKVFAKVIDEDPGCVMAYWGVAMCNFHPLWAPPSEAELRKGSRVIELARSLSGDVSTRESAYVEAIATIYDQWETFDHQTRLLKFEEASERVFRKYPDDNEAAIFYALAVRAAADPADKSFARQKKAGEILNAVLRKEPDHPGVAHYIIHNYDYPELATLALPAARKYASIAAASAHAQHMPSHIFIRLGLWDESIASNLNSIAAAQCYAENTGIKGHWDEELHGMDYLLYAYLQKGDEVKALEQIEYLRTIDKVFPENFKDAYSFAAMPARYALERKNWEEAADLELRPSDFPWVKFPWEKANVNFARLLGAVHLNQLADARKELDQLRAIHHKLVDLKQSLKANFLAIQVKTGEAWIKFMEGKETDAAQLMKAAADIEDMTEKEAVTPGEVIPARELLGDLYMAMNEPAKALEAYEINLERRPNRFNGLYGAGLAAERSGNPEKALLYYKRLLDIAGDSRMKRPELKAARSFTDRNI